MKTRNTRRGGEARPDRPARTPHPIDAAWVEGAAAEHLARYASTRAHLKQLLLGRIRRAALKGRPAADDIAETIEAVLDRHVALGTLNDAAWAEMKARSLTRRGVASAVVKQRLRDKGVPDAMAAMVSVADEMRGPTTDAADVPTDLVAACVWARRKRVGPFSRDVNATEEEEPTDRHALRAARDAARAAEQKILASMGRAGFSFTIARQVLQLERDEADALLQRLPG
jgi:regulatory protein